MNFAKEESSFLYKIATCDQKLFRLEAEKQREWRKGRELPEWKGETGPTGATGSPNYSSSSGRDNTTISGGNNAILHACSSSILAGSDNCSIFFGVKNVIESSCDNCTIWNGQYNKISSCCKNARVMNLDNFTMTRSNCLAIGVGSKIIFKYDNGYQETEDLDSLEDVRVAPFGTVLAGCSDLIQNKNDSRFYRCKCEGRNCSFDTWTRVEEQKSVIKNGPDDGTDPTD